MKVTSTKSIHFPKLNWGINAGEVRDLPEDKDAQERILAEDCITEAKEVNKESKNKSDKITSNNKD